MPRTLHARIWMLVSRTRAYLRTCTSHTHSAPISPGPQYIAHRLSRANRLCTVSSGPRCSGWSHETSGVLRRSSCYSIVRRRFHRSGRARPVSKKNWLACSGTAQRSQYQVQVAGPACWSHASVPRTTRPRSPGMTWSAFEFPGTGIDIIELW